MKNMKTVPCQQIHDEAHKSAADFRRLMKVIGEADYFGIHYVLGNCPACDSTFMVEADAGEKDPQENPRGPRWSDYVRGEWWLTADGDSMFADQDIGEAGHEVIAVDMMLDKDVLLEGLLEAGQLDEGKADAYRHDDVGASAIFFSEKIPDPVGIAAAGGSRERWDDLNKDARLAFAKHEGAILVINMNFYAWKITQKTIRAIQDFVMERVAEEGQEPEEIDDDDSSVVIEEGSESRHTSMSISDLLTIKYPGQLWDEFRRNPVFGEIVEIQGVLFSVMRRSFGWDVWIVNSVTGAPGAPVSISPEVRTRKDVVRILKGLVSEWHARGMRT